MWHVSPSLTLITTWPHAMTASYWPLPVSLAKNTVSTGMLSLFMLQHYPRQKYKLKTSIGVSDEFYANYGTGQGSGNLPAIWSIVSSPLFDYHQAQSHGAYFCTPDHKMSVSLSMMGFVYDNTGQVNDFVSNEQPHPDALREIMKHDAQLWSDLLWLSGGLLELNKCFFHQVHFDFQPDGTGHPSCELVFMGTHSRSMIAKAPQSQSLLNQFMNPTKC